MQITKQSKLGIIAFVFAIAATTVLIGYATVNLFDPPCEGKGCVTGAEEGEGLANFIIYYGSIFILSAISLALGLVNLCQKQVKKNYGTSAVAISSIYLFIGVMFIYGMLEFLLP